MRYWWVNQNQSHRHEIGDGYMWSPKLQQDGKKHFSYEYMKHVEPGDIIFSYANSAIIAVGVAQTICFPYPKPSEFGNTGTYWSDDGWKILVNYRRLAISVRTIDHIARLRPFLPTIKSPLRPENGYANQAYLFEINKQLAQEIAQLIDHYTVDLVNGHLITDIEARTDSVDLQIEVLEDYLEDNLLNSAEISDTEKETLIKSRRGQGRYREQLLLLEPRCRVTGVNNPEHLIASHIKPWRNSNNVERLDPENGFMLTPTIDHLFDKGFISFDNDSSIILSDVAKRDEMIRMGVIGRDAPNNIGVLRESQKNYLDWHRENILLS